MIDLVEVLQRIPSNEPHWLFPLDEKESNTLWRELSLKFHPDVSSGTEDIQSKINELKNVRGKLLKEDMWLGPNQKIFYGRDKKTFKINFLLKEKSDAGTIFTGKEFLFIHFEKNEVEWGEKAWKNIKSISSIHLNEKMKQQFTPILPVPKFHIPLEDGGLLLVLNKPNDMVPLSWVFSMSKILEIKIEPKHLAWIVSGLMDFSCWCEACGLHFNSPETRNFQISLDRHIIAPWGGWHFAVKKDEKVTALTGFGVEAARIVSGGGPTISTPSILNEGVRIMLRSIIKEHAIDLPKPWLEWMNKTPVGVKAWEDFAQWEKARELSFGKRSFQVFPFSPERILSGQPALKIDDINSSTPKILVDYLQKKGSK